ncbi:MAG: SRPBCC family protein [Actinomycetes bacterium]
MEHIELEISVLAPAEQVWAAITNWPAQDKWMLGTKVKPIDGDGTGVGGKIAAFTGIGPLGFLDTMEITVWNPPTRCDVLHTGRIVRGTGTFEVVSIGEQASNFIWSEDLDLPLGWFGKAGFAILRPAFVFGVRKSLEKFAHLVEMGKI